MTDLPTSKTKLDHLVDGIIRDVCELPDYNSPEDNPELLQATCSQLEAILRNRLGDETAEPRKHEQAMRLLRKYLDRECNPFEPNNQSETYKELAAFLYPTSPEEPRETSARDILQRLVDTCELATGAPWPALDEARAFLSGSPEEPTRELSPSEAASFAKTLARSPRRVEPSRPLPDHLKPPVKADDPCPAFDATVHEEHEGKCIYCGAPMPQVKASAPHVHQWQQDGICGGAICACGVRADHWYCPDSSDHVCHYDKGDFDQCDFCGQPEERK